MQRRKLGSLDVPAVALGAPIYNETTEEELASLLACALDLGVDLIDTSDAYLGGWHEAAVGRALKGRRAQAIVSTKFGNLRDKNGNPAGVDGRPAYVAEACERSLKALATDVIDLYYIHRIDPNVPIEDTVGAMAKLKEQGKIRHLGICEAAPATLRRAHATHPMSALQTEYSLWSRDPESALLDVCAELDIGFVAYSPLGRGFLTGTVTDATPMLDGDLRRLHPRFQAQNMQHNRALVDQMQKLADAEGCTPAQLATAWLLHRREFIVPVPGTKRIRHLEENVAAAGLTLSSQTLEALEEVFAPGAIAGERYPPALMSRVNL